jgi:hypothetical protein
MTDRLVRYLLGFTTPNIGVLDDGFVTGACQGNVESLKVLNHPTGSWYINLVQGRDVAVSISI